MLAFMQWRIKLQKKNYTTDMICSCLLAVQVSISIKGGSDTSLVWELWNVNGGATRRGGGGAPAGDNGVLHRERASGYIKIYQINIS